MKLQQHKLFPTNIFLIDDVIDNNNLTLIKKDILNNYNVEKSNWQSQSNLHTIKTYNVLTNSIIQYTKQVFDNLKYEYEKFVITDMWSNVLKPKEMHRPHTHSNNILSGVFYVESKKSSGIVFYDPRPQAVVLNPKKTQDNLDNATVLSYDSLTNRMIFFPTWLQHYVPTNQTNENRISIAFNIMLKGKVGDSKDLQSSIF